MHGDGDTRQSTASTGLGSSLSSGGPVPAPPKSYAPPPPALATFLQDIRQRVQRNPKDALSGLRQGQRICLRIRVGLVAAEEEEAAAAAEEEKIGGDKTWNRDDEDKGNAKCAEWDLHFWKGESKLHDNLVIQPSRNSHNPDSCLEFQSMEVLRSITEGKASPPSLLREGKLKVHGNRMILFRLRGLLMSRSVSKGGGRAASHPDGDVSLDRSWPTSVITRRSWMSDEKASACLECNQRFTFLRRRHHCRFCGKIFCHRCVLPNPYKKGFLTCVQCRRRAAAGSDATGTTPRNIQGTDLSASIEDSQIIQELRSSIEKLKRENSRQNALMNKLLVNDGNGCYSAMGLWVYPLVVFPLIYVFIAYFAFPSLHLLVLLLFLSAETATIYVIKLEPRTPLRRSMLVITTFANIAMRYKIAQIRANRMPEEFADALWEITHRTTAEEVYRSILSVQGLYIKLGQAMSGRADILPPPFVRQLKKLQDCLDSDPEEHVTETIQQELKASHSELFSEFNFTPVASASIAQVHKATLRRDGRHVAVKLQHKGVDVVMKNDAIMVRQMFALTGWVFPNQKPVFDAITEFVKRMEPELDFREEAASLRTAVQSLRALPEAVSHVIIPSPVDDLVTRRILVMDWIEASKLPNSEDDSTLDTVQRQDVASAMVRSFAHFMLVKGEFMCDPHPGNFLVQPRRAHLKPGRGRGASSAGQTWERQDSGSGKNKVPLAGQRSMSFNSPLMQDSRVSWTGECGRTRSLSTANGDGKMASGDEKKARGSRRGAEKGTKKRRDTAKGEGEEAKGEEDAKDKGDRKRRRSRGRGTEGDLWVSESGSKLVILDFGMAAKLTENARIGFCKLIIAIQGGSIAKMLEALHLIGLRLHTITQRDANNIMLFLTHLYRDTAPANENRQKFADFVKAAKKRREEAQKAGENGKILFEEVPVDWMYYNRTYSLLRGACCQLGARVAILDIFSQAARRGLSLYQCPDHKFSAAKSRVVSISEKRRNPTRRRVPDRAIIVTGVIFFVLIMCIVFVLPAFGIHIPGFPSISFGGNI